MNVKENPNQTASVSIQKRLFSVEEASAYLGLGKSSTRKYLESIGAKQQIGRRVLYDKAIIDQHLNNSAKGGLHNDYYN